MSEVTKIAHTEESLARLPQPTLRGIATGLGLKLPRTTKSVDLRREILALQARVSEAKPTSAPPAPVAFSDAEASQEAPKPPAQRRGRKVTTPATEAATAASSSTSTRRTRTVEVPQTSRPCYARPGHKCGGEGTYRNPRVPAISVCEPWATGRETRFDWELISA